jgi:hypothetical protein
MNILNSKDRETIHFVALILVTASLLAVMLRAILVIGEGSEGVGDRFIEEIEAPPLRIAPLPRGVLDRMSDQAIDGAAGIPTDREPGAPFLACARLLDGRILRAFVHPESSGRIDISRKAVLAVEDAGRCREILGES